MIKIFWGAGVVKPSKPLPPMNNFCLYPLPVLRCFWKDPLMTHHPTSSIFHCYPLPIHHPFSPKNFDHTFGWWQPLGWSQFLLDPWLRSEARPLEEGVPFYSLYRPRRDGMLSAPWPVECRFMNH